MYTTGCPNKTNSLHPLECTTGCPKKHGVIKNRI